MWSTVRAGNKISLEELTEMGGNVMKRHVYEQILSGLYPGLQSSTEEQCVAWLEFTKKYLTPNQYHKLEQLERKDLVWLLKGTKMEGVLGTVLKMIGLYVSWFVYTKN
ncbi:hypothetical protein V2G26_010762 [Clonostachys chloroleuca]